MHLLDAFISFTRLPLTQHHTMPTFKDLRKEYYENTVGKGENIGNQQFSHFSTRFSILPKHVLTIEPQLFCCLKIAIIYNFVTL